MYLLIRQDRFSKKAIREGCSRKMTGKEIVDAIPARASASKKDTIAVIARCLLRLPPLP